MLAGGEPFLRSEILDITADFPRLIFPIFTNGTLLDDSMLSKIRQQKNVIPVISLEGYENDTDSRRGEGVYQRLLTLMGLMKNKGLFYGTSITVTRSNLSTVTGGEFVRGLISSGCRVIFYVEYVPFKAGTEDWVLSEEQKSDLKGIMLNLRKSYPAIFIAFPEDEAEYGGCLSSGRGFVHISPCGDLEPCPFSPYSDVNLKDTSLKDALKSELLEKIRLNKNLLDETKGGCALWENREWVASLIKKQDRRIPANESREYAGCKMEG
jgi:MoaA/NifB/PqqE/SkfB family radical SAM enzyme